MTRILLLALLAPTVFISCASNEPYKPDTHPEKIEFAGDRLDVYPDDIRKDLAAHLGQPVVWAGIIRSTDAREKDQGVQIVADTVFEHHYFDWVQDHEGGGLKLAVSPRGEGLFRAHWTLKRTKVDSSAKGAEHFAGKGKLAIFYGTPESIDPDGTVVMNYRYLRIIDRKHYTTGEFDYGRMGDSFRAIHPACTNSATACAAPMKKGK